MIPTKEQLEKAFYERFPISIDYPPITEDMEVFTQIEIDRRHKRALAKQEEVLSFIHSIRESDRAEVVKIAFWTGYDAGIDKQIPQENLSPAEANEVFSTLGITKE